MSIQDTDQVTAKRNGICERFHKMILHEFYQVVLRKTIYETIDSLQNELDNWLIYHNNERTSRRKICCAHTSMATLEEGKAVWVEKVF